MTQNMKIMIVALLLVAVALIVPHSGSFVVLLTTRAMCFAILAMSVDLLLGFTGLVVDGPSGLFRRRRLSHRDPGHANIMSASAGISGWW